MAVCRRLGVTSFGYADRSLRACQLPCTGMKYPGCAWYVDTSEVSDGAVAKYSPWVMVSPCQLYASVDTNVCAATPAAIASAPMETKSFFMCI